MWSAVNLLKNGPRISDLTKRNGTQLSYFGINEKLA